LFKQKDFFKNEFLCLVSKITLQTDFFSVKEFMKSQNKCVEWEIDRIHESCGASLAPALANSPHDWR
jgi:hypothetical protein